MHRVFVRVVGLLLPRQPWLLRVKKLWTKSQNHEPVVAIAHGNCGVNKC